MNTTSKGSLTLIVLLFGVFIMGLLFVRMYVTPNPSLEMQELQPNTASGTPPTTAIGAAHADVDAARAVRGGLEEYDSELSRALEE
jgi:hypothetical protein